MFVPVVWRGQEHGIMEIIQKPTPNFDVGRGGFKPEMIILHCMVGSLLGTDNWFSQKASKVSSNYGMGFFGEVHQYVKDEDTAYAQGLVDNPNWNYRPGVNPNKYCLSIENEGGDISIVHEAQIQGLVELIMALATKWSIPIDRAHIRGHYEIRITKPNCPATDKRIIDTIVRRCQQSSKEEVLKDLESVKQKIINL